MKKELKDLAASVRQRLLNRAKETHRPFDELLQYFAMERFLYRLSLSKYKDKVVLKGALMFIVSAGLKIPSFRRFWHPTTRRFPTPHPVLAA